MIRIKQESQETIELDLTQPPLGQKRTPPPVLEESKDLFSSLISSYPYDRQNSTVNIPYEPATQNIIGSTPLFFPTGSDSCNLTKHPSAVPTSETSPDVPYESGIVAPGVTRQANSARVTPDKPLPPVILTNNDGSQQSETGTLFSRYDTLPDTESVKSEESYGSYKSQRSLSGQVDNASALFTRYDKMTARQTNESNINPSKKRCMTSETAPDLPPSSQDSNPEIVEMNDSQPPPALPPVDYRAFTSNRLNPNTNKIVFHQGDRTRVDVSAFKLPEMLTTRQEHDLLSAVWKVLF